MCDRAVLRGAGAVPATVVAALLKSPQKTITEFIITYLEDVIYEAACSALRSLSTAMSKVISSVFHSVNSVNML